MSLILKMSTKCLPSVHFHAIASVIKCKWQYCRQEPRSRFYVSLFLFGVLNLPFPFLLFLFLEKKEKKKSRKERTKEKNKRKR